MHVLTGPLGPLEDMTQALLLCTKSRVVLPAH